MFLACFSSRQYSRGTVVANHVPPTQRVIVMSRIRPAYAFVTSRNATLRFHLFYFISDVQTSARLK